ncbi:MAG: A/G-specific adenine glycosylase [Bacteriovoracaceae bacterium]|nr:A/G-specific adenine glycosylase [Bacteriovoracaceae bacterium]
MFKKLLDWSQENFSHLPWRKNRTLYSTLVSEMMLQQTTVPTVINFFTKFMQTYPNLGKLAKSSEEDVLLSWKGLGYYRRARFLHKAAQELVRNHKGQFPLDKEKLLKISGIGVYTAHALLAIGANENYLCVDANLERVLSRVYLVEELKGPKLQHKIYSLFSQGKILKDLNRWGARDINEALMDLGREICLPQKPKCTLCPLKKDCLALQGNVVEKFPLLGSVKKQKFFELELLRVIVKKDQKVLVYKKSAKEWLSNQYELPTFILKSEDAKLIQYPSLAKKIKYHHLPSYKTGITKYKITNYILELGEKDFLTKFKDQNLNWKEISLEGNLSVSSLKALKRLSSV